MFDPVTTAALVSGSVAMLTSLLLKAAEKAAETIGEKAVDSLVDRFKRLFGNKPRAAEAVAELEALPNDADAQASLRLQLRKAIEADPALGDALNTWMGEAEKQIRTIGHTQTATISGDSNRVNQIFGSCNKTD